MFTCSRNSTMCMWFRMVLLCRIVYLEQKHCPRMNKVIEVYCIYVKGVSRKTDAVIVTARNEVGARLCFLQVCVILFTRGGEYLTRYTPLGPGTPPPGTRYTPRARYTPLHQVPTPPGPGTPPRAREIRSTRGRYASYWNAILFSLNFWSIYARTFVGWF